MRKNRIVQLAAVIVAAMLAWGCGASIAPQNGSLVLSFTARDLVTAKNIEPMLDMEVAYYDVYGSGPGGASFEQLGVTDTLVTQASLVPGEWTIDIEAYNADDPTPTLIGEGSVAATVVAGDVLTIIVTVSPVVGEGQLEVTVQWPEGVLLSPLVEGTLTPMGGSGSAVGFTNAGDELSASYTSPAPGETGALANGYYTLALTLETDRPDGSGSDVVWGTVEVVRIITGQLSTKNFALVEDVNRGGLGLTIELQLEDSFAVSIQGVVDPLSQGQDMTVSASPAGADGYEWYVDGVPVATGNPAVLGAGLWVGYHWLNVVVTSGSVISSGQSRFEVIAAPASGDVVDSDMATGTTGTQRPGQSFNETRAVALTVLSSTDRITESLTLNGLNLGGATSALVGARIYDDTTHQLVAYSDSTIAGGSNNVTVTIPITATLISGQSYRVGFYVETSPLWRASGNFFAPDLFSNPANQIPYTESTGIFRVNSAHSIGADSFPAHTNLFVVQMNILTRSAP